MKHSCSGECFSVLGENKSIMAIEGILKFPHIVEKYMWVGGGCIHKYWVENRYDKFTFAQWFTIVGYLGFLWYFFFFCDVEITVGVIIFSSRSAKDFT